MEERRALERFDLRLRAKVVEEQGLASGNTSVQEIETENICSGGAFFRTLTPLVRGTRVKIEIALNALGQGIQNGQGALVRLRGEVLRTAPGGMVVCFDRPYRIAPMLFQC